MRRGDVQGWACTSGHTQDKATRMRRTSQLRTPKDVRQKARIIEAPDAMAARGLESDRYVNRRVDTLKKSPTNRYTSCSLQHNLRYRTKTKNTSCRSCSSSGLQSRRQRDSSSPTCTAGAPQRTASASSSRGTSRMTLRGRCRSPCERTSRKT